MGHKTIAGRAGLAVLGSLLLAGPAWSIPTTDYPGWVVSMMKYLQGAQNMAQTASNYAENVMQTYMMAINLKNAPLQTLSMMNGPPSQTYDAYMNLSYQSNTLANDISGQNMAMAGAYNSFSLSGLSPAAFVKAEQTDAYGSNAVSQNEVQAVQAAAQKTNSQIASVQKAEQAIPSPANKGVQKQMQLLNSQMVALRKQNIELNSEIKALELANAMKNKQRAEHQGAAQANRKAGASSFAGWRKAFNKSFGVNAPPGSIGVGGG